MGFFLEDTREIISVVSFDISTILPPPESYVMSYVNQVVLDLVVFFASHNLDVVGLNFISGILGMGFPLLLRDLPVNSGRIDLCEVLVRLRRLLLTFKKKKSCVTYNRKFFFIN